VVAVKLGDCLLVVATFTLSLGPAYPHPRESEYAESWLGGSVNDARLLITP